MEKRKHEIEEMIESLEKEEDVFWWHIVFMRRFVHEW
jgi:hypothetical protein